MNTLRDFDVTCATIVGMLMFILAMMFVIQKIQPSPSQVLESCLIKASQTETFDTKLFRECVK